MRRALCLYFMLYAEGFMPVLLRLVCQLSDYLSDGFLAVLFVSIIMALAIVIGYVIDVLVAS